MMMMMMMMMKSQVLKQVHDNQTNTVQCFENNLELGISCPLSNIHILLQGAYKFSQMNSLSFPGIPDTISSDIQTMLKCKLHPTIHAK